MLLQGVYPVVGGTIVYFHYLLVQWLEREILLVGHVSSLAEHSLVLLRVEISSRFFCNKHIFFIYRNQS